MLRLWSSGSGTIDTVATWHRRQSQELRSQQTTIKVKRNLYETCVPCSERTRRVFRSLVSCCAGRSRVCWAWAQSSRGHALRRGETSQTNLSTRRGTTPCGPGLWNVQRCGNKTELNSIGSRVYLQRDFLWHLQRKKNCASESCFWWAVNLNIFRN